jgi:hypothetical protein
LRQKEKFLAFLSKDSFRKLPYKTKRQGRPVFVNELTIEASGRLRPVFVQEEELFQNGIALMK